MATKKQSAKASAFREKKQARRAAGSAAQTAPDAVDEQLARYRSMRDFGVTAEPSGATRPALPALPFCVQKHAASHLHYDFRLGWNGVLKSWACAKGPSYVVADKRLSIEVEDHPIEYGGFEGIIPAGQYGGGTVMLWDQGTWEPQAAYPDVNAGLRDGSLKFLLHGEKLKGKWALIRIKPKPGDKKPAWLLIKEHDEFERPATAPSVLDEEDRSVITGRTMEEIAASEDHVWNSKETAKPGQAWFRKDGPAGTQQPAKKTSARSTKSGAQPGAQPSAQPGAKSLASPPGVEALPKEHQPTFLKPQLAEETKDPPSAAGWIFELKLDGYRVQARKDGANVQMLTRSGLDWTARMRSIAEEIAKLPVDKVTLDGEVVVVAANGTTNFADLQASMQEGARNPLTYFAFDLLHIAGRSPRALPLLERKRMLADLIAEADAATLQISEHLDSNGPEMFRKACELHAEGIVSKKAAGCYREGRSSDWLKSKCLHEQEFVIGGFTHPSKGGPGLGALLLGYYDKDPAKGGRLIYAGRTGTGFTQKMSAQIRKQLEALAAEECPFKAIDTPSRRGAKWVRPELVAQVRFATWTADQQVRQAAFLGLREDKPAAEVRREEATTAPRPKGSKAIAGEPASAPAKNTAKPWPPIELERAPVRLTHPAKILDADTRLTKQQLADYYWAVAERMLPHIAGRPLSLVRCPEGSEKPCFYQKHVNHMLPKGVEAVDVPDKKTGKIEPYITLATREALAGMAQMGVLEVHPWGSSNLDLEHPNQITIDLDPDEALPWPVLTEAAEDVRARLRKLGLQCWVKTTGGKGLHVVVPVTPVLGWDEVKQWAHRFVLQMERANPALYLSKMTKAARTGKIYLDYLRNERGATAVAPYSPRARKGAGVAVPLAWPELRQPDRPVFRVANFAEWGARLKKDVWADMLKAQQSLPLA